MAPCWSRLGACNCANCTSIPAHLPAPASCSASMNPGLGQRSFLLRQTGPERPAYPARRHNRPTVDTLATPRLTLPGCRTARHFRPEGIGPALQGAHGINTAAPVRPQEHAAAFTPGCRHQLTRCKTPQIATPEPAARQLQVSAYAFRLLPGEVDVITATGNATAPATGTGKPQWLALEERLHVRSLRNGPVACHPGIPETVALQ